jgi:tetratricopeptide (TPR) repeat protein
MAIEIDENDTAAYHNRGITYKQLGLFDEALADFTQAITIDPNYAEAYYNRHLTYLQRGHAGDDRAAKADMDRYRHLTQSMGQVRSVSNS